VRTVLLLEGAVIAVTGVVLGAVASLATVLSYSEVKLDRLVPDLGPGVFVGIAAIAVATVLASTYVATRRALRPAAVDAVALVGG
jgi:putative ABC transport system permease protein